jgi:heptosyltransferase I
VDFIEFDKRGGWGAISQLRAALSDRRFDVLLHMQVAARANLLSLAVRAPIRLGWDNARSRDGHRWFVNHQVPPEPFQHQVQGFLSFARTLGLPADTPRWDIPVSSAARAWASEHLPFGEKILLISPCSSHERRNWSAANYALVGDHASREHGLRVILSGGPSALERRMGSEIGQLMKEHPINLIGKDTLPQSLALLERADLVMSPDSGPAHIASALGTPVLGLYAATWSRRSGPYNSLDLCVDRFAEAARKYRGKAPEELRWGTRIEEEGVMDLVTPAEVINKLDAWAASS